MAHHVRSRVVSPGGEYIKDLMTQDELLNALEKAHDVAYVAPGAAVHASVSYTHLTLPTNREV